MKRFRVVGKLKKQTVKALGPYGDWDSIISRLTLPTEGGAGDGYNPNLVRMVEAIRGLEKDAEAIAVFGDDSARELRREVGAKWAEVCGVGAKHGDVVLFQHIASIMEALDAMKKRPPTQHLATLWLVRKFVQKHNRLPLATEVTTESGGRIKADDARDHCDTFGVTLPKIRKPQIQRFSASKRRNSG